MPKTAKDTETEITERDDFEAVEEVWDVVKVYKVGDKVRP